MALAPGSQLGPYQIVAMVGIGGMGEVYRAHDARLGRDVAVKVLASEPDADRLSRFEREARATGMLAHPNIVTIFDVGSHEGRPFLVSELLEGVTLREQLMSGPLGLASATEMAIELSRGVAAAHALRIVHRDLKPENVFLTRRSGLKILDFGLAKLKPETWSGADAATVDVSAPGTLLGTPAYMAPEQVRGEPLDGRCDIFAIGVMLFEMLAGAHPFRRATPAETLAAILRETPSLDSAARQTVPRPLIQLVARCLEKDPGDRFQTADDLAFALELALGEIRRESSPSNQPQPSPSLSIAVLPFADMSPTRDQDYLCEGIAEELINAFTHVDGLRVVARSLSFQFRSDVTDVRAIGARLGVGAVLEGSVRKAGERLRVNVRLIDVKDGFHRWTERYDQRVEDVFAIQDEIAERVATALRGMLSPLEKKALHRPGAVVECYEYFLRARRLMDQFDRVALLTARGLLDRAVDIDRKYAPAHAALGEVNAWLYEWWGGSADDYAAADRSTLTALNLAPQLAEAHAARGFVLSLSGRYDEAAAAFEDAIRLNPNLFEAYYLYARSAFAAGRIEESAKLFEKAGQIRLEDFQAPMLGAQSLIKLGRKAEGLAMNAEGIRRAERHLDLVPDDARALSLGSNALIRQGRFEQGLQWSKRAVELHPDDQGVLINGACSHAKLGLNEEALALLERTFAKGYGKRDWITHDPDYDNIRSDPRFQAMVGKLR